MATMITTQTALISSTSSRHQDHKNGYDKSVGEHEGGGDHGSNNKGGAIRGRERVISLYDGEYM